MSRSYFAGPAFFCELHLYVAVRIVYRAEMRDVILKSVIVAMLFVTMEGMAEPVDDATFHQTHHAHADDGDGWYPDSDGSQHESEACEHFCHVHVIALTSQISVPELPRIGGSVLAPSIRAVTRSTAPPTPPPNI
ncbi:MAG: hypothetical protein ACE5F8_04080 [Woeseiaceae bacterium]